MGPRERLPITPPLLLRMKERSGETGTLKWYRQPPAYALHISTGGGDDGSIRYGV